MILLRDGDEVKFTGGSLFSAVPSEKVGIKVGDIGTVEYKSSRYNAYMVRFDVGKYWIGRENLEKV